MSIPPVVTLISLGNVLRQPVYQNVDYTISWVHSDVGSITLVNPKGLDQVGLLGNVITVLIDGKEPTDGRFFMDEEEVAGIQPEALRPTEVSFTGRTLLSVLENVLIYPSGWGTPTPPYWPKPRRTSLGSLIIEARNRGAFSSSNLSIFDANNATTGTRTDDWWQPATPLPAGVPPMLDGGTKDLGIVGQVGTDLLQYALSLVKAGERELAAQGLSIKEWGINHGSDWTQIANPVVLRVGRDITAAPIKVSARNMKHIALVAGDNGTYVEANIGAIQIVDRRELSVSLSGVNDPTMLSQYGQAQLTGITTLQGELTFDIAADAKYFPLRDFRNGDWIYIDGVPYIPNGDSVWSWGIVKYRVKQIIVTNSGGETRWSIVVGQLTQDAAVKQWRTIQMLDSGQTIRGTSQPDNIVRNSINWSWNGSQADSDTYTNVGAQQTFTVQGDVNSNRRVRYFLMMRNTADTVNHKMAVQLYVDGAPTDTAHIITQQTGNNGRMENTIVITSTITGGDHTFQVMVARVAGTGVGTLEHVYVSIDDCGAG